MFRCSRPLLFATAVALLLAIAQTVVADGLVVKPRNYKGSLEERAQEAIIVFHAGSEVDEAEEDLILKISVTGEADQFAWIIPLPSQPDVQPEDAALFAELFKYVETRRTRRSKHSSDTKSAAVGAADASKESAGVTVLSRKTVGKFDVAVVREETAGMLNVWLEDEGFQTLPDAEDVIGFYRKLGYVFTCIKVSETALGEGDQLDLHPLRFTFRTGGRDGIYFPMRLTGLQSAPFDINLYVFYRYWLNDQLNSFGYKHHGFELIHRDWDTPQCEANGGKAWSAPLTDPYLHDLAESLPAVTKFFQKRHAGSRFYLTNIQARNLQPQDVRNDAGDLWLFPYYTRTKQIPYDASSGQPAALHWPHRTTEALASGGFVTDSVPQDRSPADGSAKTSRQYVPWLSAGVVILVLVGAFFVYRSQRLRNAAA